MAEFPAMPLWTDAYLGDTTHLKTIEHGAYLLLLLVAWRSKNHCLPDNDRLLAEYCKLRPEQWKRIKPRLEPFFEIENGFWFHGRLLDELEALRALKTRRSVSGSIGAGKRWNRAVRGFRTRLSRSGAHDSAPNLLTSLQSGIANASFQNGKAIAPTPTKTEEGQTEKKKGEQVNGTSELLAVMQRKGWVSSP